MFIKYLLCLYFLSTASSDPLKPANVYETIDEDTDSIVRIVRHPKHRYDPPNFDYATITQQDPQKIRYAQQQEVDSYLKAYQLGQQSKRNSKTRKIIPVTMLDISTVSQDNKDDESRQKSENKGQESQISVLDSNVYPIRVQVKKVVESKHNRMTPQMTDSFGKDYQKSETPKQIHIYSNVVAEKKVLDPKNQRLIGHSTPKLTNAEKVDDKIGIDDQEMQASNFREAKIYLDQQELLKNIQLPANYLTKPTYLLANPQHAKLLSQGLQYASVPQNVNYGDFEPASKSDIDALSALLGKGPNAQLQGLTDLLHQQQPQQTYQGPQQTQFPGNKGPDVQLQGLTDLIHQQQTYHVPQASQLPVEVLQPQFPINQPRLPIKQPQLPISQPQLIPQAQALIQKSHTPITEEVRDVVNNNLKTAKAGQYRQESQKSYGEHENLQYAAQYAFGYKVRDYHSGSNFGHEEVREGDDVKGHYHVVLPDGRLQNVEYWADPSGYHAKVTYTQVGHH